MNRKKDAINKLTSRENFLITLLNKVTEEYKTLLEYTRRCKPLKIVEIINLTTIPGETNFIIQVTNKSTFLQISAAEIIYANYNLNDFSIFHAEMIRKAAQGKLIEFLKLSEKEPRYKIESKQFDAKLQQYIFTIESKEHIRFIRNAEELSKDKDLLSNLSIDDIYDIGHTQGSESILREKTSLMLAKIKVGGNLKNL